MDEINNQFSEALVSRICHDVISPVSAIANGLELLNDNPDPDILNSVISLLKEGSKRALNILQFFRLVMGAGYQNRILAFAEIKTLVDGYFDQSKIKLTWPANLDLLEQRQNLIRPILLTIALMPDLMPKGGQVIISSENRSLKILLNSTDLRLLNDLQSLFKGEDYSTFMDSKKILWFLLGNYLRKTAYEVELVKSAGVNIIIYHLS